MQRSQRATLIEWVRNPAIRLNGQNNDCMTYSGCQNHPLEEQLYTSDERTVPYSTVTIYWPGAIMKSGHITKLAFVTVLFWHCLISARAESRPVLSSNVNQDAYVTALADTDQSLQAGKGTEAAHKYAPAARLLPVHSDTALKAAGLLAAANEYLDAAEMAALGKDATKIAEERKAATQLLEQLKPHFQIDVDLQFFRALREVPTGGLAAAGATMEKISRFVNDPLEGRLTHAMALPCC